MSWLPGEARVVRRVLKISVLSSCFSLRRLGRKSEPCEEETCFLVSWYNLPYARNFKSLFEFQIPSARNYPAGTSELIPLAPTRIYVEIVRNMDIVALARNHPVGTLELFPLGANSDLRKNSTLRRNFFAGV